MVALEATIIGSTETTTTGAIDEAAALGAKDVFVALEAIAVGATDVLLALESIIPTFHCNIGLRSLTFTLKLLFLRGVTSLRIEVMG